MINKERISFLKGKSLSLNMIAMASPSEKFNTKLKKAKAKFQVIIRANGPRKAGLVKNSLKLANPMEAINPGRSWVPSGAENVPLIFW